MANRLIYYVCYGKKQQPNLFASVASLRTLGRYTGEIRVFTDEALPIDGCDRIELVEPTTDWEKMSIARVYLGLKITGDYSEIAYLDNDVLVVGPLDRFFSETQYFRAMAIGNPLPKSKSFDWPLDETERPFAMKMRNICSGAIVSCFDTFMATLATWRDVFESAPAGRPWRWKEQSALNVAVFRNKIKFKGFDESVISERPNKISCLVHYYGPRKDQMLSMWAEIQNKWKMENRR